MLNLLVVDDEPMLADGVSSLLQTNFPDDLTVYTALSGEKAFAILEQIKIDLLLTDINMPDVDGLELQRRACERWPHLTVIFLTGHSEFHYMQTAIQQNAYHIFSRAKAMTSSSAPYPPPSARPTKSRRICSARFPGRIASSASTRPMRPTRWKCSLPMKP